MTPVSVYRQFLRALAILVACMAAVSFWIFPVLTGLFCNMQSNGGCSASFAWLNPVWDGACHMLFLASLYLIFVPLAGWIAISLAMQFSLLAIVLSDSVRPRTLSLQTVAVAVIGGLAFWPLSGMANPHVSPENKPLTDTEGWAMFGLVKEAGTFFHQANRTMNEYAAKEAESNRYLTERPFTPDEITKIADTVRAAEKDGEWAASGFCSHPDAWSAIIAKSMAEGVKKALEIKQPADPGYFATPSFLEKNPSLKAVRPEFERIKAAIMDGLSKRCGKVGR